MVSFHCLLKIFLPLFVIVLFLPESRVNCRQHFFAVRIVAVWNSLPDEVVSADSLSVFIRRLRAVDLSDFLMGKFNVYFLLFIFICSFVGLV